MEPKSCPNFLCNFSLEGVESMVFVSDGENKELEVNRVILDHLHIMMFMSINCGKTIESFKTHGKEMVVESFNNLKLGVGRMRYFWAYYY